MGGLSYDWHFYPRSPCGERLLEQSASYNAYLISIHALLAESDCAPSANGADPLRYFYPRSPCGERPVPEYSVEDSKEFLSTLSLRRATVVLFVHFCDITISIHALLAESDKSRRSRRPPGRISIHALLAESDSTAARRGCCAGDFYPRSPCGERPVQLHAVGAVMPISIHALLAESDPLSPRISSSAFKFLSTLSLRRATGT